MPFTLAHSAAALPLRKALGRFGSLSGLALGSMIPDLAYFLPLGVSGSQTHSLLGLFLYCLPAGVVSWILYCVLLRPFALALAPRALADRMQASRSPTWSVADVRAVGVSVVIGAATHLAWDSFTHSSGFAVQALPALRVPVYLFEGYSPKVFTLFQHSSTLAGLTALAIWAARWFWTTPPNRQAEAPAFSPWSRSLILTALVVPSSAAGLFVLWLRLSAGESAFRVLQNNLGRAIFSAGTVFLTILMLSALAWRAWQSRLGDRRGCPTRG